jgi:hypothetical protein
MFYNSICSTVASDSYIVQSLIDIQAFVGEYVEIEHGEDIYTLNSDYGVSIYNDGNEVYAAFAELDFKNMMEIKYAKLSKSENVYYPFYVNRIVNKIINIAEKLKSLEEDAVISTDKGEGWFSIMARKENITTFKLNVMVNKDSTCAKEAIEQLNDNNIKIYFKNEVVEI